MEVLQTFTGAIVFKNTFVGSYTWHGGSADQPIEVAKLTGSAFLVTSNGGAIAYYVPMKRTTVHITELRMKSFLLLLLFCIAPELIISSANPWSGYFKCSMPHSKYLSNHCSAVTLHQNIYIQSKQTSCINTIFVSSHMYPENSEGTQVIVGSMNMEYISDTARNRAHNLFRPKREPIPLGHSDGHYCIHSMNLNEI